MFKNETGSHVVQRIPPTEVKGRRQTSVVSVVILPLKQKISNDIIKTEDIEIIAQTAHGKGGQHQNRSHTSIRACHRPSGLRVFIVGRSQKDNKKEAIDILYSKILNKMQKEKDEKYNKDRLSRVNTKRGSKIRTYNFLENRIVDHRNNKKLHNTDLIFKKGKFDLLK